MTYVTVADSLANCHWRDWFRCKKYSGPDDRCLQQHTRKRGYAFGFRCIAGGMIALILVAALALYAGDTLAVCINPTDTDIR